MNVRGIIFCIYINFARDEKEKEIMINIHVLYLSLVTSLWYYMTLTLSDGSIPM